MTTTAIADRAHVWGDQADISARSVLVTVLGDSIAPVGGTVWLADLITLVAPFGFNDRLVRTSMFRLGTERWVQNERVGRRSRYSLTTFARDEFAEADIRIYRDGSTEWDGQWTLVFADGYDDVQQHLHWRGFGELSKGVFAGPNDQRHAARQLFDRLGVVPHPLTALSQFDAPELIAAAGPFRDSSGLSLAESSYQGFIDTYSWATPELASTLDPCDAFLLRTMVVHDLRRARLKDPDLPDVLLPRSWPGVEARTVAAQIYHAVSTASWRWIEELTGLTPDPTKPAPIRFAASAQPERTNP